MALDYFQKEDATDYDNLMKPENASELKKIKAAAKAAVVKDQALSRKRNLDNPRQLAKHISKKKLEMVKEGLTIPTYALHIRKLGDISFVDIVRDGEEFLKPIMLSTREDILQANELQYASIVIESIILLAQVIGIKADISSGTLQQLVKEINTVVAHTTSILAAVDSLRKAMQGGTRIQQAQGVWRVIRATYDAGIMMTIMKSIFDNMTYWDWIKSVIQMAAVVASSISTDGIALVAKIALALASAAIFVKKFTNLTKFEVMSSSADENEKYLTVLTV